MSDSGPVNPSPESDLPRELKELTERLEQVEFSSAADTARVADAVSGVVEMVNRRRRVLELVQEAMSQLRLDLKYLMFDLEVTRRERDELQTRLEEIERGY